MARETPSGTADGVNTVFTLSASPAPGTEIVIVDRLLQKPVTDYNISGPTITFTGGSVPQSNAIIDVLYGQTGIIGVAATPPWEGVASLVSDAAIELGLISTPVSDVYGSTDPNIVQLRTLLKSGCREISRMRNWTHIVRQFVFSTITNTSTYDLPVDFRCMIDQSGWTRTTMLPLGGPLDSQTWQYLQARAVGAVFTVLFRPWQGQLHLYPTTNTPGGYSIAFEYASRYFVQVYGSGTATSETPSANTDVITFEPHLVIKKLKLDFLRGKRMDYTAEEESFSLALAQIKADDASSPILSVGGVSDDGLLGERNIPVTGYG